MTLETNPAPEAVKSESPVTVTAETVQSAVEQEKASVTPEAKANGSEQQQTEPEKKEPSEAELRRKERNRERWQAMKSEREEALRRAQAAEAELARIRNAKVDYSQYEDPDEALAARTAQKVRESFAGDHEAMAQRARQQADAALFQAWDAIKADMRERAPDFDQVVTPETPIHARAAPFLVESDKGGEIAYYLGKNPDVARELYDQFESNPARALIKLGRLEAEISKPQKAVSSAPKPAPVLSGSAAPPAFEPGKGDVGALQKMLRDKGILR